MQPKIKVISSKTTPNTVLNTFQKQDMAPEEWEVLADQVLTRATQKTAEEILNAKETMSEEHATGRPFLHQGFLASRWLTNRRKHRSDAVKKPTRIKEPSVLAAR